MKYSALLLALAPVFAFAQSAPPVLNFEGEISVATCNIAINGSTASPTVALSTARQADLSVANNTAAPTPFTMMLSGCDNSATASIKLVPTAFTAGGNLKNLIATADGGAANVNLQLYNAGGTLVMATQAGVSVPVTIVNNAGTSVFGVRYVAEGGSGGNGQVKSTVQYAVSYL